MPRSASKTSAAVATTAFLITVSNSAMDVSPSVGPLRHFEAGERGPCRIREHAPRMTVAPAKRKWRDFRPGRRRGWGLPAASARLGVEACAGAGPPARLAGHG